MSKLIARPAEHTAGRAVARSSIVLRHSLFYSIQGCAPMGVMLACAVLATRISSIV